MMKIKVGDKVTRYVQGDKKLMDLKVTNITDDLIFCGPWKFSTKNGAEVDEDLGWDESQTGTYIKLSP